MALWVVILNRCRDARENEGGERGGGMALISLDKLTKWHWGLQKGCILLHSVRNSPYAAWNYSVELSMIPGEIELLEISDKVRFAAR